jgi:hypothetical protein
MFSKVAPSRCGHSMSYQSSVRFGIMFVKGWPIPLRSLYELSKFRAVWDNVCRARGKVAPSRCGHSMSYQSSAWLGLMFVKGSKSIPVRSLYELSKFRTVCVHVCRVFQSHNVRVRGSIIPTRSLYELSKFRRKFGWILSRSIEPCEFSKCPNLVVLFLWNEIKIFTRRINKSQMSKILGKGRLRKVYGYLSSKKSLFTG